MKLKQKMIIRLPMDSDKCRSKALQTVARAKGAIVSVSIGGSDRNELVVIGGVDPVTLVQSLRKKFRQVSLLSVQQIGDDEEKSCKRQGTDLCPVHYHGYSWTGQYSPAYYAEYPQYPVCNVAQHALEQPSICNIM